MRAIFILSALCVSHVALSADDRPAYEVPGTRFGIVQHNVRPYRQTRFGLLLTDLMRNMDTGEEFFSCELLRKGQPTVEADCDTGKPQD